MAGPENHSFVLLREIRGDIKDLDRKVDKNHAELKRDDAELKEVIDGLVQTLAGEMAARLYA